MKEIDFEILRKYVKCFGLLSCDEDSECPFRFYCAMECFSNPEKFRKALENQFKRRRD